ncbi:MAG: hypothetical protein ABSD42_12715 [Candidatus Bathyarchaeia archaeon]|jgi:hypothetical protein
MATNIGTTFAYIVSLVGGLIILIASILNVVWYSSGAPNFGGYGSYIRGMMDGYHNFMGSYGRLLRNSSWNLTGRCDLRRHRADGRYHVKGPAARSHDLGNSNQLRSQPLAL